MKQILNKNTIWKRKLCECWLKFKCWCKSLQTNYRIDKIVKTIRKEYITTGNTIVSLNKFKLRYNCCEYLNQLKNDQLINYNETPTTYDVEIRRKEE